MYLGAKEYDATSHHKSCGLRNFLFVYLYKCDSEYTGRCSNERTNYNGTCGYQSDMR